MRNLVLIGLTLCLTACANPPLAQHSSTSTHQLSNTADKLLPGEVSGCDGDCGSGKPDIDE
jgi:hypothetical protein